MQRISTDKARSADITVGFKTEQKYAEWVHRAAAKAGMSASAYQRKVTLEWAAADLGISSAEVAEHYRHRRAREPLPLLP